MRRNGVLSLSSVELGREAVAVTARCCYRGSFSFCGGWTGVREAPDIDNAGLTSNMRE